MDGETERRDEVPALYPARDHQAIADVWVDRRMDGWMDGSTTKVFKVMSLLKFTFDCRMNTHD